MSLLFKIRPHNSVGRDENFFPLLLAKTVFVNLVHQYHQIDYSGKLEQPLHKPEVGSWMVEWINQCFNQITPKKIAGMGEPIILIFIVLNN